MASPIWRFYKKLVSSIIRDENHLSDAAKETILQTNKYTLALYWRQIRKYKLSFFAALICIPLGALLIDTLLPYFFSQTLGALASSSHALVWSSLVLAAIAGTIGAILNFSGFQALTRHEANVRMSLSDATFSDLMRKDVKFFIDEKVGALTSRYIDFIRSHESLQDLLIVRTLGFVISVGVGLLIVASQSLILASFILFLLVVLVLEVRWSIKKRSPWRHARKILTGEIHGSIADAITNNLIVKTFAAESREIKHVSKQQKTYKKLFIKDVGFVTKENSIRVAIMVVIQVAAIGFCVHLVLNKQLSLAITIFALTYLQRIASQLLSLGEMLNGYDQALLEASPLSDVLQQNISVVDSPRARKLKDIKPSIKFENVSYHYSDDKRDVIHSVNLSIKAGEKVGLVGRSGAGKSTITHLLLRFNDVTEGNILINNQDIRSITQASLRQNIAYVPQDPMLFHRSVRENIAYGNPKATESAIRKAAKQANALDFIKSLPRGLDTTVGERGVKLSGGQRQRIAIARAILKDAPILVLDEATSALDSASEKLIQAALDKLMHNRTSIVIAHRLSTIAKLDRIIVLENGVIAEDGTHAELLSNNGMYASLWHHQSDGFIDN